MPRSISEASAEIDRPRAGRPTADRAAARHDALLDAALDHFLDRGFEPATVEAIAASVNMTKRTVYARYRDKAALFLAAVQRAIAASAIPLDALHACETDDLADTLISLARLRVARVKTVQGLKLQRIINTESYRFPPIFMAAYEQGAGPLVAFLADLLRRRAIAGTVRVERPELAATIFMSMVVGGPVRLIVSGNSLAQAEIDDRIGYAVALFMNGIRLPFSDQQPLMDRQVARLDGRLIGSDRHLREPAS